MIMNIVNYSTIMRGPCGAVTRCVWGGGGGGGEKLLPQNIQLRIPSQNFGLHFSVQILVECYMKTAKNGQCADISPPNRN